jgi:hypothetical protein
VVSEQIFRNARQGKEIARFEQKDKRRSVTPRPLFCETWLSLGLSSMRLSSTSVAALRLGDDRAGDTRRRRAAGFGRYRVNDHGGAAVAEYGVAVGTERHVGSDDRGVGGAVSADDQRKVGDITGGEAAAGVIVIGAIRIEMRAGRLEVGSFALGELMDMQRVLARRKIFDVELDANAVGSFGKRRGADDFVLAVLDFNGERLGRRRRRIGGSREKEQAQ